MKSKKGGARAQETLARIDELPIKIVGVDRSLAPAAAIWCNADIAARYTDRSIYIAGFC